MTPLIIVGDFGADPEVFLREAKAAGFEVRPGVIYSDIHANSIDITIIARRMEDMLRISDIKDISKDPRKGWKSRKQIYKEK